MGEYHEDGTSTKLATRIAMALLRKASESAGREMTRWDLVASQHPGNIVVAILRYDPHIWTRYRQPFAGNYRLKWLLCPHHFHDGSGGLQPLH